MKSIFSRLGTQAMKYTFELEVHDVVLPLIRGLNEGDKLHLSLERGSKVCDGEEVTASAISSIGDMTTEFNQTLSIGVTLFKDKHGNFQEKLGTLSLKQRKKGAQGKGNGKDAFKTIGVFPIEFHALTERSDEEFSSSLLMGGRDGAVVNFKLLVHNGGIGGDDDDRSSVSSFRSSTPRNMIGGSSSSVLGTAEKKKKKSNSDDDDDDEDDWKPNFNKNKKDADNNDNEEEANPFDVPNPFETKIADKKSSSVSISQATPMNNKNNAKSPDRKNKINKKGHDNKENPFTTTTDIDIDADNIKDPFSETNHSIDELLSPESMEWKNELIELKKENKLLKEREENLITITNKAEFFVNEAKRLESLLLELQQQQTLLIQQKEEYEAELKGRIAENEILVEEVINSKLALVELSTQLDVTKKTCYQLKNKLGITNNHLSGTEVNNVRQQLHNQQQGGGGAGNMKSNINSDDRMKQQQQQHQRTRQN